VSRRTQFASILDAALILVIWLGCLALLVHGLRLPVGPFRLSITDPVRYAVLTAALLGIRLLVWRGRLLPVVDQRVPPAWAIPHLVVSLLFFASIVRAYEPANGFTSLIRFGDHFAWRAMPVLRETPHTIVAGGGYDGQFYAQIALDPLLRTSEIRSAVDSLSYRARRILFPWIAFAAGGGDAWRILQAYALLNVAVWSMVGVMMMRWLPVRDAQTAAAWAGCMINFGLLDSVYQSLTDGPSLLLMIAAVIAMERKRSWGAAAAMAIGLLGRETNLLGSSTLVEPSARTPRDLRRLAMQILLIALPFCLWLFYLWTRALSLTYVGDENTALPFVGFAHKWAITIREMFRGDAGARSTAFILLGATIQALVLASWYGRRSSPWWRLGIVYAAFMFVLGPAVWDGNPGSFPRIVLPAAFAFNVLLPRNGRFWRLWCLGNAGLLSSIPLLLSRAGLIAS
jgi:hypothetical protein